MYREIAAKALVGKGKLPYFIEKTIYLEKNVSKTLGCWIINLEYETVVEKRDVFIRGSYSIQLWYAMDQDKASSVYEEKITFEEKVMMSYRNMKTLDDQMFLKVFVSKYPTCVGMQLDEHGVIHIRIESLFFVDAFQEAILYVQCSDAMEEDVPLEEEILMNVNPNYLLNKK